MFAFISQNATMSLIIYYLAINLLLFLLMGIDKLKAIFNKRRIPEARLLSLSLIGGGIGGVISSIAFRHKIRKQYFMITFILSTLAHAFIFYYLTR